MAKNTMLRPEQESSDASQQSSVVVSAGGAANQNTLRNIGLITAREYNNRVRQRSFVISTIVILVLVVIAAFVPTIVQVIASKSHSQTTIAVINNAGSIGSLNSDALTGYIATNLNAGSSQGSVPPFAVSTATADSLATRQQQVKNGGLNVLLVIDRTASHDIRFTYYTASNDSSTLAQVQTVASQLSILDKASRLGLTAAQTASLFTPPTLNVVNTAPNTDTRSTGDIVAGIIIAYVGIILIFMSIFMYGLGVAQGVAEEKGTRIMEILVNAATPLQLMVGKILGIGAAGLTQMVAIVIVGLFALLIQNPIKTALLGNSSSTIPIDITGPSITLLILLLVYFVLGFLLYASLFAALGALVKRQDEVQNVVQPITWLFMVGYIVSFIGISNPNATWVKVISYIPFWTPTTMLMRAGAGTVQPWEIALTIVLMILCIIGCMFISARIYRFGVLMYGQKPGLGQLVKMIATR